jgi:hypothetical protein
MGVGSIGEVGVQKKEEEENRNSRTDTNVVLGHHVYFFEFVFLI